MKDPRIKALAIATEIIGLLAVGIYAGHAYDKSHGASGVGILVGSVLAIGIWLFRLIRMSQ